MPAAPTGTASPFDLDFGVEDLDFDQDPLPPLRANKIELPVIPLRDMVIFPRMVTQFFVGRDISMRAVEEAMVTIGGSSPWPSARPNWKMSPPATSTRWAWN